MNAKTDLYRTDGLCFNHDCAFRFYLFDHRWKTVSPGGSQAAYWGVPSFVRELGGDNRNLNEGAGFLADGPI